MDGLDSVKCQKSRRRDMMGINRIVNDNKTEDEKCSSSSKRPKKGSVLEGCSELWFCDFLERESTLSPGFRPIGPSVLDGARNKVALHGEGYAWTPIWWSSENSKR